MALQLLSPIIGDLCLQKMQSFDLCAGEHVIVMVMCHPGLRFICRSSTGRSSLRCLGQNTDN